MASRQTTPSDSRGIGESDDAHVESETAGDGSVDAIGENSAENSGQGSRQGSMRSVVKGSDDADDLSDGDSGGDAISTPS